MTIWQILGIEKTDDLVEIRKAYAEQIKKHKPETDPEGFQLVRSAYEAARQFALGEPCAEAESETCSPDEDSPEELPPPGPQDLVFYLTDLLRQEEQEALQRFQEIVKKGLLDNLEFSESFQQLMATRLTDKAGESPEFTCYLIDYFNWYNHPAINSESLFGIALRTLMQQTAAYRFFQGLELKSLVNTKEQAKEQGLDWNYCCAVKALLGNKKTWWPLLVSRKKKKAIAALLADIDRHRLSIMNSELDANAYCWRENYTNARIKLRFGSTALMIIVYVMFILAKHGKLDFPATKPVPEKAQSQTPVAQKFVPSTSTTIALTFTEHAGKKLHGSNHYMLHIPAVKNAVNEEVSWNIILFDKDYQLLKSPVISSSQPVFKNKDGSVDIYLQAAKPRKDQEINWLATPEDNFIIVGQFYWKKSGEVISRWDGLSITETSGHG